ncbi:hypothetical protein SKAU_G00003960 [Synaphobranchus kaupii]|uniref:Uncharacterized protein n=1 Tax=Synaphobranchus kaupii TaxID=118154 RepID=A0A9Q1JBH8_SYNKA|nr:hypothetical protein SKAU_G00003960 [Synaphobranchus kaupii]
MDTLILAHHLSAEGILDASPLASELPSPRGPGGLRELTAIKTGPQNQPYKERQRQGDRAWKIPISARLLSGKYRSPQTQPLFPTRWPVRERNGGPGETREMSYPRLLGRE